MTKTITVSVSKRTRCRQVVVLYPTRHVVVYHPGKQPRHYHKVKWGSLRRLCQVLTAKPARWAYTHKNDYALSYALSEITVVNNDAN